MVSASAQPSVVERLFDPVGEDLPRDVAKYFLGVNFTETDLRRIAALSEKANEGDLTPHERQELSEYVLLNDLLVIMHSRAKTDKRGRSYFINWECPLCYACPLCYDHFRRPSCPRRITLSVPIPFGLRL